MKPVSSILFNGPIQHIDIWCSILCLCWLFIYLSFLLHPYSDIKVSPSNLSNESKLIHNYLSHQERILTSFGGNLPGKLKKIEQLLFNLAVECDVPKNYMRNVTLKAMIFKVAYYAILHRVFHR